jgi:hypothetical protein
LEQGALAAAAGTHDDKDVTVIDGKIEIADSRQNCRKPLSGGLR